MAITNRDEAAGKARKASGVVKEKLGKATGSRRLEEQGAAERTAGATQATVGKVAKKAGNALRAAKKDLRRP